MYSSLSQNVTVPHTSLRKLRVHGVVYLILPLSYVAAQQVILISPVLGEVAAHHEDGDVLVHELGLVALGYAFNLFAESVV